MLQRLQEQNKQLAVSVLALRRDLDAALYTKSCPAAGAPDSACTLGHAAGAAAGADPCPAAGPMQQAVVHAPLLQAADADPARSTGLKVEPTMHSSGAPGQAAGAVPARPTCLKVKPTVRVSGAPGQAAGAGPARPAGFKVEPISLSFGALGQAAGADPARPTSLKVEPTAAGRKRQAKAYKRSQAAGAAARERVPVDTKAKGAPAGAAPPERPHSPGSGQLRGQRQLGRARGSVAAGAPPPILYGQRPSGCFARYSQLGFVSFGLAPLTPSLRCPTALLQGG